MVGATGYQVYLNARKRPRVINKQLNTPLLTAITSNGKVEDSRHPTP